MSDFRYIRYMTIQCGCFTRQSVRDQVKVGVKIKVLVTGP
jgi:hypothetical protein